MQGPRRQGVVLGRSVDIQPRQSRLPRVRSASALPSVRHGGTRPRGGLVEHDGEGTPGDAPAAEWRDGADGWRGAVPLWRAPPLIKDADKSIQIESRADRTDRHNSPTTTDDYEPQELRRRRMA